MPSSRILTALLAWAAVSLALAGEPALGQVQRHIEPSMVFETRFPEPGSTTTVAIRMRTERGWHGYWSNPGDSGLPVEAMWRVPDRVTLSSLRHPAPSLLDVQGITSYVHEGDFTLLARMRVPEEMMRGSKLPVRVSLNWLACSDTLCVPERASLAAELTVGSGQRNADSRPVISAALQEMPKDSAKAGYSRDGRDWVYTISGASGVKPAAARLYPESDGWFVAGARQSVSREGTMLRIRVSASGDAPSKTFNGVISDGSTAYSVLATADRTVASADDSQLEHSADIESVPAVVPDESGKFPTAAGPVPLTTSPQGEQTAPNSISIDVLRIALLGALVGGLLLNLMPCVFPILSLKALSLAKSGGDPAAARREGLGYAAGTISTAVALGGLLLGLRAIGLEVGWSFQLQSPGVILVLLVLTSAIALNLAGLFEVPVPFLTSGSGQRKGWLGGFSTGALAAVIAMPCSGPFMAGALGAALVLPAPVALGVFAALGLGMALPFLALAYIPPLQRRLPKPGIWMETLRRILAIPMFVTALALAWLLGRQTGVDGMAIGLIAALIAAASLWWMGLRQRRGLRGAWTLIPGTLAVISVLMIGIPESQVVARVEHTSDGVSRESFSEARLTELRAAGTPVFLDFTADWCLICQVNEQVAIDTDATRAAFAKIGVVTLVGDWTRQDPAITRFLEKHGRNSIPFYLYSDAKGRTVELPQVLTSSILVDHANASSNH